MEANTLLNMRKKILNRMVDLERDYYKDFLYYILRNKEAKRSIAHSA